MTFRNHPKPQIQQPLVVVAGVLATPVGVRQLPLARQASRHRHHQNIDHQPTADPLAHRPADDRLRVQVFHRLVQEALGSLGRLGTAEHGCDFFPQLETFLPFVSAEPSERTRFTHPSKIGVSLPRR